MTRLATAWNALHGRAAPASSGALGYGSGFGGPSLADAFGSRPAPSPAKLVEAYKSILFFCVNLNADGVVRVPLRLYAASGNGRAKPRSACGPVPATPRAVARLRSIPYVARSMAGSDHVDEVTTHPLLDVLDRPDPDGYFDRHQLLDLLCRYVDVVGAAYLKPVEGAFGVPAELWPLQAQYVWPLRRTDSASIDCYRYFAESYRFDELLRFRLRPDLGDPYGAGYAAARAAWEYAGLEDKFVSVQDRLLSSPRPGLFVSAKDAAMPLGDPERRVLEAKLNQRSGAGTGGSVVTTVPVSAQPMSYAPADLGGLAISAYNLERIANCFSIPMPFLTKESNLANMQAAESAHARNAIEPRCRMIAAALTRMARTFDDRLFFAFDSAVTDDRIEESRISDRRIKNGTLTINEARDEDGYEPVPWGDEPWQSNSLIQPSAAAKAQDAALEAAEAAGKAPPKPPAADPEKADAAAEKAAEAAAENPKSERSAATDGEGEQRSPFLPRVGPPPMIPGEAPDPHETNIFGLPDGTPISKALRKAFEAQLKAVLGTLPEIGSPLPADFPPLTDYTDPMAAAMTPTISAYWDEAGKLTRAKLGLDPDEWTVTDPHLQETIRNATLSFADSTNRTTSMALTDALAKLRDELTAGLFTAGETIPQLTKRVQAIFDTATKSRAEMIARTEASRAVHTASLMSAKGSGVVRGKKWLLSSNACPLCHDLAAASDADAIALDDDFGTVGDHEEYSHVSMPPGHPHCRCTVVYALTKKYQDMVDGLKDPPTLDPGPLGPEPKPKAPRKPREPKAPKIKPDGWPADALGLEPVKGLGGSTGAALVKDPATGKLYVLKKGNSADHLREEVRADALYQELGARVPKFKLYETPSGPVKLAEFVEGRSLGDVLAHDPALAKKALKDLGQHFGADALLGNWDVVGMSSDNILVDAKGRAYRIDNGGSLGFRAQGAKKTADQWDAHATELWTLRDPKMNPTTAKAFEGLSFKEILKQLDAIDPKSFEAVAMDRATRNLLNARLEGLKDVGQIANTLMDDKFTDAYADRFAKHTMGIRKAGISDKLPKELRRFPGGAAVTLEDENGLPWDHLRGANSLVDRLAKYVDAAGGNYEHTVADYMDEQAGNSWNDAPKAYKAFLAEGRTAANGSYFWKGGYKGAAEALRARRASVGASTYDESMTAMHAFTRESLSKIEFDKKDAAGTVKLMRTENRDVMAKAGLNRGDQDVLLKRGAAESTSIYRAVAVHGSEMTVQDVPLHRIVATYFQARRPGVAGGAFMSDGENEFIAILDDLKLNYGQYTP